MNIVNKLHLTFSCIVSVYNGEKFIERCINSIINQTKKFDKILIYDDASKDTTRNKLKDIADKENLITIIEGKQNRGPGGGKNFAASFADTDYFMFVDADDYIEADYLKILAGEAEKNFVLNGFLPDIVISNFKGLDEEGNIRYIRKFKNSKNALYEGISNWGKLFRRCFWTEHHLKIPEGKVLEDVLLRSYIVGCAPNVTHTSATSGYCYVKNLNSVSHTYMNQFIDGVADVEMNYLYEQMKFINTEEKEEYLYWVYKVYCWHMLKSGSGVGYKNMKSEYNRMHSLLDTLFNEYKKNRYLSGRNKLDSERRLVLFVVRVLFFFDKVKIQKFFLYLYSIFNLQFLWPNL